MLKDKTTHAFYTNLIYFNFAPTNSWKGDSFAIYLTDDQILASSIFCCYFLQPFDHVNRKLRYKPFLLLYHLLLWKCPMLKHMLAKLAQFESHMIFTSENNVNPSLEYLFWFSFPNKIERCRRCVNFAIKFWQFACTAFRVREQRDLSLIAYLYNWAY